MIAPLDDVDRIMAVMATAFDTAFGEAWSRRQVMDALVVGNCHYALIDVPAQAPRGDTAAGGFWLSRSGVDEEELLLLGVDPKYRRQGLGTAMLKQLAIAARSRGAHRLLLEMRKGNPAGTLYDRFGFRAIGERRNYYSGPGGVRIDAITFALALD